MYPPRSILKTLCIESLESRTLLAADPMLLREFDNFSIHDYLASGDDFYFVTDQGNGGQVWRSDGTKEGTIALTAPTRQHPGQLTAMNGNVFFTTDPWWLWKTDGTSDGTEEVEAFPTAGGNSSRNPSNLTALGNTMFFSVYDRFIGGSLWRSNGTTSGTSEVMSFGLGSISGMANVDGVLYLSVDRSLWKSDGTAEGTVRVKDGFVFNPSGLTDVDGRLFFTAQTTEEGNELWTSDGSSASTKIVNDIQRGAGGSAPRDLKSAGGMLYFSADDGSHGRELWMSDGTVDGTSLVADIHAGAAGSNPGPVTPYGDGIFFSASSDGGRAGLWKASNSGATLVTDQEGASYPASLTVANDTLYFSGSNAGSSQLWQSDGTDEGTKLVPGLSLTPTASQIHLAAVADRLFIKARDLWVVEFESAFDDDDINRDGQVDVLDVDSICAMVVEKKVANEKLARFLDRHDSAAGDANFDSVFNSSDLIVAFAAAKYETDEAAKWSEGDWNCDGVFDSGDLVAAFKAGWYAP